ncbi:hypothetical protein ACFLWL_00890 [Chloroflexota bacterium]
MKKKALIGVTLLLVSSMLLGACNVPNEEIEKYLLEMGEVAKNLNAINDSVARGNWEEAQKSLGQAQIHHSNIDAGIDDLEQKGVDSTQIERGRAASTYLNIAHAAIDRMLIVHIGLAELKPLMEGLSEGTKEDVLEAIDKLNALVLTIRNTKSAIQNYLDYAKIYYGNNPEDAKKLKADTTIPKFEQLYKDLDAQETTIEGYISTLSQN